MTPLHPMSSWAADWIGELQRYAPRVRCPAGARMAQLAEFEAQLGLPLPADARACYAVANGDLPLWPGTWLNLRRVLLRHRLMCTVAEHLRPDEPGWSPGDAPLPADAGVRRDAWHAGWIPIGENRVYGQTEYLCLDTVPGPAGRWGQLIVVQDPTWLLARGEPVPPARRVADGLLPHLWQVLQPLRAAAADPARDTATAVGKLLENPMHAHVPAEWVLREGGPSFEASPVWPAWREATRSPSLPQPAARPSASAAAELSARDLAAVVRALSEPWTDGPVPHVLLPRPLTVMNPSQTEANEPIEPSTLQWFGGSHARCAGLDRLRAWAEGKAPPRGLLLGGAGIGKTMLLRELARSLPADTARPLLYVDLAALVDWDAEPPRAPASLAEVFAMQARRRGVPVDPGAMLAALAADRFALVLDHVEALAPVLPAAWRLADALPATGAEARILMVCAREWFKDGAQLRAAVDALALWSLEGPRGHWLACLHDVASAGLPESELCRLLGIDAPRAAEAGSALNGLARRGVPGEVIAARAAWLGQDAGGSAGSTDEALHAAFIKQWWSSRLPAAGRWEREHADRIVADLATALARRGLRSCPPGEPTMSHGRLDDWLRRRCGGLPAPRRERLRLHLVQAMMLKQQFAGRLHGDGVTWHWPAMQLAEAMASDDDERVLAVVLRWSRHWSRNWLLIQPAGQLWRQRGRAAPCGAVVRLLQRSHGPRVTACLQALAEGLAAAAPPT